MSPKNSPHPLVLITGFLFVLVTGGMTAAIIVAIASSLQPKIATPPRMPPTQITVPTPTVQNPPQAPAAPANPPGQGQWYEPIGEVPGYSSAQQSDHPTVPGQYTEREGGQSGSGLCAHPDDLDSQGRRCGNRSAYSRGPTTGYDSNR